MRTWILTGFLLIFQALKAMAGQPVPINRVASVLIAILFVVGVIMDALEFAVRMEREK
jgi:uncharacterized membrane protein